MAVIRDAVIRLRVEQQKAKIEAPNVAAAEKAYKEGARAGKQYEKSAEDATKATKEYNRAVQEGSASTSASIDKTGKVVKKSFTDITSHLTEGMEGVARFTRGVALLSSSSEEDFQKILRNMMKFQAGFDIIAGGAKFVKGLALAFGPVGIAAGVVGVVLTGAIIKWNAYKDAAKAALRAIPEGAQKAHERLVELGRQQQALAAGMADLFIAAGLSEPERDKRRDRERERLKQENSALNDKATAGGPNADFRRQTIARELREMQRPGATGNYEQSIFENAKRDPAKAREQLTLETQLRDNMHRRVNLEREAAQQEADRIRAQAGAYNAGLSIGIPFGVARMFTPQIQGAAASVTADAERKVQVMESFLDGLVEALKKATQRVEVLDGILKRIEESHTK